MGLDVVVAEDLQETARVATVTIERIGDHPIRKRIGNAVKPAVFLQIIH